MNARVLGLEASRVPEVFLGLREAGLGRGDQTEQNLGIPKVRIEFQGFPSRLPRPLPVLPLEMVLRLGKPGSCVTGIHGRSGTCPTTGLEKGQRQNGDLSHHFEVNSTSNSLTIFRASSMRDGALSRHVPVRSNCR